MYRHNKMSRTGSRRRDDKVLPGALAEVARHAWWLMISMGDFFLWFDFVTLFEEITTHLQDDAAKHACRAIVKTPYKAGAMRGFRGLAHPRKSFEEITAIRPARFAARTQ